MHYFNYSTLFTRLTPKTIKTINIWVKQYVVRNIHNISPTTKLDNLRVDCSSIQLSSGKVIVSLCLLLAFIFIQLYCFYYYNWEWFFGPHTMCVCFYWKLGFICQLLLFVSPFFLYYYYWSQWGTKMVKESEWKIIVLLISILSTEWDNNLINHFNYTAWRMS